MSLRESKKNLSARFLHTDICKAKLVHAHEVVQDRLQKYDAAIIAERAETKRLLLKTSAYVQKVNHITGTQFAIVDQIGLKSQLASKEITTVPNSQTGNSITDSQYDLALIECLDELNL